MSRAKKAAPKGLVPVEAPEITVTDLGEKDQAYKQRCEMFCQVFVRTGNAAEAARCAGYAEKNARITGYQLLAKSHIQERVRELREAALKKVSMDREKFIALLVRSAENEDEKPNLREQARDILGRHYALGEKDAGSDDGKGVLGAVTGGLRETLHRVVGVKSS